MAAILLVNEVKLFIDLECPPDIPAGTALMLALQLPTGEKIRLTARLQQIQSAPENADSGIYLVNPAEQKIEELEQFLRATAITQPVQMTALATPLVESSPALTTQIQSLQRRIQILEEENREFADHIVQTEEANNNLTNIYIASSRLHSQLDLARVKEIIHEVVINLIGAEKFALILYDRESSTFRFESGEGFAADEFPVVQPGEGRLGETIAENSLFVQGGPAAEGSDDPGSPLAAIPLSIHGDCVGLLAIYRLFTQKEKFEAVDFELFTMLAEQAAAALFSADLYETSERKRQTIQGAMDLLLK